jgi:hypothetical protein
MLDMAKDKVEIDIVDWHLKKEVSYGHIISTIILLILMVGGWVGIQTRLAILEEHPKKSAHSLTEKRLDNLESAIAAVHAQDVALTTRLVDFQAQLIRRLDRQDIKLDRIEDRLNKHDTNTK